MHTYCYPYLVRDMKNVHQEGRFFYCTLKSGEVQDLNWMSEWIRHFLNGIALTLRISCINPLGASWLHFAARI